MPHFSIRIIGLVVFFLSVLVVPAQAQPEADDEEYVRVPVNLSFVPGLSVGESIAGGRKIINTIAFNVLAGRAARLHGIEFGGIWNAYTEDVRGVQWGGAVNTVGGAVRGAQFAGVLNLAGGRVHGAQFGGVVNVAAAPVRGAQVAGVVNVAPRVERGVQVAVVNVAEEHGGVPLGLVSYVGDTGLRYDVWGNEAGMVTAAVRSGNRRVANYLGVGARPGGDRFRWGVVAGLGVDFPMTERIHGTLDLLNYNLTGSEWDWDEWTNLSKVRLLGRFNVSPHVAIFGGPTFNVLISDDTDGSDLIPWSVYEAEPDDTHVRLGPGVTFGVRLAMRAL